MKLTRFRQEQDGGLTPIKIDNCRCQGVAMLTGLKSPYYTAGRRGPPGGVCGACGGAIPSPDEEKRIQRMVQK